LVWALVHGIYEISSPDGKLSTGEEGMDQSFYNDVAAMTSGNPKATGTFAVIIQLGIVPFLYGILWLISLPCRRYKRSSKRTKQKSKTSGEEYETVYTRVTDDGTMPPSDIDVSKKVNDGVQLSSEV
jgi:hypothetical protein